MKINKHNEKSTRRRRHRLRRRQLSFYTRKS